MINASKRNKYDYVRMKREAIQTVGIIARSQLKQEIQTPAVFSFTWYCPNKRKDPDNVMSGQKYVFDGLQEYGLLKNDGWGQIAAITHSFHVDKQNPRVEIEIMEGVEVKSVS